MELNVKDITGAGAYYEVGGKLVFKTTEEAAADTATYTETAKVADVTVATAPATTITIDQAKASKVTKIQAGSGSGTFTTPALANVVAGTTIDLTGLTLDTSTIPEGGCTYVIDDDELTAKEGDTVTFASSATSAAKVTLPNGSAATVAGVTYTASGAATTVDKDGKVTGSADLSVSAAEDSTVTVDVSGLKGNLTVAKGKGKGTVNVVGATSLDNITAGEGASYTVDTSAATLTADNITATVGSEDIKYGANGLVIAKGELSSNQAYYTATIKDKGADSKARTTNYAWSKFDGDVTIDLSSSKDGYKVLTGTKGASTVLTGAGDDSIVANTNDTVNAGKGDDVITVSGAGVTIVKNQNTNNDSVTGFAAGFDSTKADVVKLDNASGLAKTAIDSVAAAAAGGATTYDVTLYTSSTKNSGVNLKAAGESQYLAKVKIATGDDGVKNYEFIANTRNKQTGAFEHLQTIDADADVVYGSDVDGSGVKLESKTTDTNPITVINLSGINNAKIGDKRTYGNISYIDATASTTDNVLVSSGTMNSEIKAGSGKSSIWGGVSTVSGATAANDLFTLHATGGKKDHGVATIFTGAANGKDTVDNYSGKTGDLVYAYGDNKLTSLTENVQQGYITLGFQDGTELSLSTDKTQNKTADTTDTTLNMYATAWGDSVKAQVGTYMTASKDTAIYYATRSATLEVTNDFDGDKLWLYQEVKKDGYTNAKVNGRNTDLIIDATSRTNDVNIAGTSKNDTIRAGQGTNALFGGAGTDALYGNADGQTTFYFGKDLGANTTVYVANKADKVVLYNVTASDLTTTENVVDSEGTLTLSLTDGSKLTVKNFTTIGNTLSLSGTDYTYDSTGSKLTAKA